MIEVAATPTTTNNNSHL